MNRKEIEYIGYKLTLFTETKINCATDYVELMNVADRLISDILNCYPRIKEEHDRHISISEKYL